MISATLGNVEYPIILIPGIMGTQLRNDLKSDTGCAGRPSGKLWLTFAELGDLTPLYLNDAGDGPSTAATGSLRTDA